MTAFRRVAATVQSRFVRDDEGASLVEYALLVALIAIVAVVAITSFGEALSEEFSTIADELPG